MNHANQPENLSYFHFNVRSLGKNKHELDDFPNDLSKSYFYSHIRNQVETQLHCKS